MSSIRVLQECRASSAEQFETSVIDRIRQRRAATEAVQVIECAMRWRLAGNSTMRTSMPVWEAFIWQSRTLHVYPVRHCSGTAGGTLPALMLPALAVRVLFRHHCPESK